MITRRNFLKNCSFAGLGAATGLAANLASFNAFAADTNDYKALVCVFLSGGMDGHDMLIPYDTTSYNAYENIREGLISTYDRSADGYAPRRRNNLLPLNGSFDGREFAFPQEMSPLQELYNQGDMAIVGNVGPLIEPLTRATYRSGAGKVPPRLGSHNDSASIWMATQPEGASSGWGGRFSDIMQAANANTTASFTSVSTAGRTIFLTGENIQAFQVASGGGLAVTHLDADSLLGSSAFAENYDAVLKDTGRINAEAISYFGRDMANIMRDAISDNQLLTSSLAGAGDPTTSFPDSYLGGQLNIVARMISRRQSLGAGRQIFYVQMGGFDTHASQADYLPGLQQDLANAMRAFHDSMMEMGVEDKVTSFTASDFGRTLSRSGSGTDHGWGNHHMVMGGAVNGGQILGEVPLPEFNHDYDIGRGRLIPQISVDQYAGTLGRWFGLSDTELLEALPGLSNFDANALSSMF